MPESTAQQVVEVRAALSHALGAAETRPGRRPARHEAAVDPAGPGGRPPPESAGPSSAAARDERLREIDEQHRRRPGRAGRRRGRDRGRPGRAGRGRRPVGRLAADPGRLGPGRRAAGRPAAAAVRRRGAGAGAAARPRARGGRAATGGSATTWWPALLLRALGTRRAGPRPADRLRPGAPRRRAGRVRPAGARPGCCTFVGPGGLARAARRPGRPRPADQRDGAGRRAHVAARAGRGHRPPARAVAGGGPARRRAPRRAVPARARPAATGCCAPGAACGVHLVDPGASPVPAGAGHRVRRRGARRRAPGSAAAVPCPYGWTRARRRRWSPRPAGRSPTRSPPARRRWRWTACCPSRSGRRARRRR